MHPNFTLLLVSTIIFSAIIVAYIIWRFGVINALSFIIVTGLFAAIMDFISAFVALNYEYPGKSKLWVFVFIFFGWTSVCGSCMFMAEGILVKNGHSIKTQKNIWWTLPLLTAVFAVLLDLFIDPVAVASGYWVWFIKGTVYFEIPLLNFVGWFVLMFCAPLAWILILRIQKLKNWMRLILSVLILFPLIIGSAILSTVLNGIISALGLQ